jgi:hypothetical protein
MIRREIVAGFYLGICGGYPGGNEKIEEIWYFMRVCGPVSGSTSCKVGEVVRLNNLC